MTIKTDRSRYEQGFNCPRYRYLRYHAEGTGLSPSSPSIDLKLGTAVHGYIECLLKGENPKKALDSFIPPLPDLTFEEQELRWLVQCMAEGWFYHVYPRLMEDHLVIAVEQEMPLEFQLGTPEFPGELVVLMARPDLVLRRKSDSKIVVVDFKTTKSFSPDFAKVYAASMQMAISCMAVEKFFKEPVDSYMMHALIKGSRMPFKKKGMPETPPRQYSHLCYAKLKSAGLPGLPDTFDFNGYWYDKLPMWQWSLSPQEWVKKLPPEIVGETWIEVGPYPRPERIMKQLTTELPREEVRYQQRLEWVKQHDPSMSYDSEILDRFIPRSYNCIGYGRVCDAYDICMLGQKPTSFQPRIPHHSTETE